MEKYQEVLGELVKQAGVSQTWLGKQLGVTNMAVYYVIHGQRGLRVGKFVEWCKILGATVTVEWKNPRDERKKEKWVL